MIRKPFGRAWTCGHYRLSWQKRSGAKLELVWRYGQWFYPGNGWAAGFMTRAGTTGLIRTVVQP